MYNATIGSFVIGIADVSIQSNTSLFAGDYNITLYIGYSGTGSGDFFDQDTLQVITNTSAVIKIGTSFGDANLTNGQHAYLFMYPSIPANQFPTELDISNEDFLGVVTSTVTLDIPAAPYSTPVA